jgi:Na+-transporting methylmalonyl-CoA/oxaloacetate decarboxylase gamma subunit
VESHSLVAVCGIAFAAVFVLLALLAVAMHAITILFPERKAAID